MPIDMSKAVVFKPIPYWVPEQTIEKEWGWEYILPSRPVHGNNYTTKIMEVKPGFKCSLHIHRLKNESFVLVQGAMEVELYAPDSTKHTTVLAEPMSSVVVPLCTPHTFSVPADQEFNTIFIESSTEDDPEDSYRLTRSGMNAK